MEVKIYNSLTNRKEVFHPIRENEVTCYVCGPTVYSYVHIGNMRPVVTFDILRRLFIRLGYNVTFISNFTDIDDKIISQAKVEGISEKEVAEKYIRAFESDRENIHSLKPDYQPRVTETMDEIIAFIATLIEKGYAYETDGDVYFRVGKIEDYGCLSNMKKEDLLVGARIDENSSKESPLDFALWKKTVEGIRFDSPWSQGRPGWHSECVVMINRLIPGGRIDIHGGGFDLKFPHHENEIAQEEAMYHHKIANYWMHNGFINIDNVKMSKSLGNVKRAVDLLQAYGGNAVRFVLINSYYRTPVNFSDDLLSSAEKEVEKIGKTFQRLSVKLQLDNQDTECFSGELRNREFLEALCDDLNTPNALSELYRIVKEINVNLRRPDADGEELRALYFTLKDMLNVLGLIFEEPALNEEDRETYRRYVEAKQEKDYARSDELRKKLIERGIL